jgi:hypothetical protein
MDRGRIEQRREEAKVRQAESDTLTPEQRLARLDEKFGKGQGAVKERAKLLAAIEKVKQEQAIKAAKKEKAEKAEKPDKPDKPKKEKKKTG